MKKIVVVTAFLLFAPTAASAAPNLYFDYPEGVLAPESTFTVTVFIDSAEDPINALSGVLLYSPDILVLEHISTEDSIVDIWSQNPASNESGMIAIEGGTYQPFVGSDASVMTAHFRVADIGTGHISLEDAYAYYADGEGSSVSIPRMSRFLSVAEDGVRISAQAQSDTVSPVVNDLHIERNPISEKLVVVFQAKDDESGILNIRARFRSWFAWTEFRDVRTPVEFPESAWAVEVQAVDNSGNTHTEKLVIWSRILKKLGILTTGVLVAVWITLYIKGRRRYIV